MGPRLCLGLDCRRRTTVDSPCLSTAGGMDGVFCFEFPWFLWALARVLHIKFHPELQDMEATESKAAVISGKQHNQV